MLHLNQAVVVEGKYDKIKLSSLLDATIIETGGFQIYKDREKLQLIRMLARARGIILLTDSDSAGFQIRSYIAQGLPKGSVTHVYIPDLYGKERRKAAPSKEGKLGVEGVPAEVLRDALQRAGVGVTQAEIPRRAITKADFYLDGLSGTPDAAFRRGQLLAALKLPERLSVNSLLDVLNTLFTYDEYREHLLSLQTPKQP